MNLYDVVKAGEPFSPYTVIEHTVTPIFVVFLTECIICMYIIHTDIIIT
jgi:hypothetical protein